MRYRVNKKCGAIGVTYEDGAVIEDGELPDDAAASLKLWGAISDFPEEVEPSTEEGADAPAKGKKSK